LEDKFVRVVCLICEKVYEFPIKFLPDSIRCGCEIDIGGN